MATEEKPSVKADEGTYTAFFYGTLMVPDVFYTVCYNYSDVAPEIKALHKFTPAILHGYCRRRVRGADYPGITPDKEHKVFGMYATGLTRANMVKLDYFEGGQYVRRTVEVKLLDKVGDLKGEGNVEGETKEAEVYVFNPFLEDGLEDKEWDLEEFRREKLQRWTRAGYVFEGCDPNDPAKMEAAV
ncbi:AIG2-like family-domain-containing protein [Triangularia verruculosa]|uniref:Putative gamma-glutamylcyclotransferase n=1 Tax=Triangularia verruculosa TaxID=2587418 RepID=A0AAN7AR19_9PEZI|nr:AIG2-like family-domain-containing protein [Triangularia verruculosa]